MRIGMMADLYKPHISGVTIYIALNKRALEAAGHQVYVFTFGNKDYQDEEENIIRSPGLPLGVKGYYFSLAYSTQARRLLQSMDVVHVHHPFISGSLAMLYCRPKGIPIIFTNHTRYDLYSQTYLPVIGSMIGEIVTEGYLPAFCRGVDLVVSPSPGMRDVLVKFGVEAPIDVVPNGVDLQPFLQPSAPISRAELGFSEQDVLLIYIGRLGPEKNLPFLLRAFAGALQAYEHAGLILVGEGPDSENLRDWVQRAGLESRIRFTGLVPYTDIPRYLAMVDAFVTASVTEVHPFTVIEAMASGLPVMGIRSPGVGDTIEDGKTGYLVQEDLVAFTARLVRLLMDPDERKSMGQQARQAAQAYSIDLTMQMMLERYQRVTDQASPRKKGFRLRLGGIGRRRRK
jgi:1,2-diacylglycerol 3-alpha-glucosyltransferase